MASSGAHEIRPSSEAGLVRAVADAAAANQSLTTVGGGTHLALGRSACEPDVVLRTGGLDRVVEHVPDDMTISIEAGMTVAALRDLLARHHSRLPIDVEHPKRSTIGGVVAFGAVGPRRLGLGSLRERLIGARVVFADGSAVKTGGMVVKNVSGYDLTRLLHGSMGALGVIASLNFKLSPLPDAQAIVASTLASPDEALAVAGDLVSTRLPFAAVQARSDASLIVGCEGHPADVKRLCAEARAVVMRRGAAGSQTIEGEERTEEAWLAFLTAPFGDRTATFRIASTQSRVATDIVRAVEMTHSMRFDSQWTVDRGCGTAELNVDARDSTEDLARLEVSLIGSMPGVRVTRCPHAMRSRLTLFGRAPAAANVMHLLKAQFDPQGTFAGRAFAAKGSPGV